ncbi:MAG TPA: PPOX class F420-dependent oxidoreductase [Ilumatobacteraceae bacterium]|jgi:PPOX class probable F420-dependent enzyme
MSIGDEKYIAFTTYKRDGTPVTTPVWAVPLDDGKLGFWTSSSSGKAKRLGHTSKVMVQPSNGRGKPKPGSTAVQGTAVLVTGPELEGIRAKVNAKYGFMVGVSKFGNKIGELIKRKKQPYGDRGVVITLS